MGACGLGASPAPIPPARTTVAPPAPVTTAPTLSDANYLEAKEQWKLGATAISAEEGNFWTSAATDLQAGLTTDNPTTGYTTAIAQLQDLVHLPDAQQTAEQNAAYHADIDALNTFFHTPELYS